MQFITRRMSPFFRRQSSFAKHSAAMLLMAGLCSSYAHAGDAPEPLKRADLSNTVIIDADQSSKDKPMILWQDRKSPRALLNDSALKREIEKAGGFVRFDKTPDGKLTIRKQTKPVTDAFKQEYLVVLDKPGLLPATLNAPFKFMTAKARANYNVQVRNTQVQFMQAARNVKNVRFAQKRFSYLLNAVLVKADDASAKALANVSGVKQVVPNYQVRAFLNESVDIIGAPEVWALQDANQLPVTGNGMVIGIIDTGIDYTHPDLGGCEAPGPDCKVLGGFDTANQDDDPFDDQGHGTHVAGIAAANGVLKGVAPDAKLRAYKVLGADGSGSLDTVLEGLERAALDGVDVINMSLGANGGEPDDPLAVAVNDVVRSGIPVVVAAGNEGPGDQTLGSPGVAELAITVAASDKADFIGSFSSRGPVPGNAFVKPDISAPGVGIISTVPGNNYASLDGTSMASPHVAGAVALIRQIHTNITPAQIKNRITTTAKFLSDESVFSQGAGRIELLDAVLQGGLLAEPHIVHFGKVDLEEPVWTETREVVITNDTFVPQTYVIETAGFIEGVTVDLSPAAFQLAAGESQTVAVSVVVDNGVSGFPKRAPFTLDGRLLVTADFAAPATEASQTYSIPLSFNKSFTFNINLADQTDGFAVVDVYDGDRTIAEIPLDDFGNASLEFIPGVFDFFLSNRGFSDAFDLQFTFIGKEDVTIEPGDALTFSLDEATTPIRVRSITDAEGGNIPVTETIASGIHLFTHRPSGALFGFLSDFLDMEHGVRLSPMTKFTLEQSVWALSDAGVFEHYHISPFAGFVADEVDLVANDMKRLALDLAGTEPEIIDTVQCINIFNIMAQCTPFSGPSLDYFLMPHATPSSLYNLVLGGATGFQMSAVSPVIRARTSDLLASRYDTNLLQEFFEPINAYANMNEGFFWQADMVINANDQLVIGNLDRAVLGMQPVGQQADSRFATNHVFFTLLNEDEEVLTEGQLSGEILPAGIDLGAAAEGALTLDLTIHGSRTVLEFNEDSSDRIPPKLNNLSFANGQIAVEVVDDALTSVNVEIEGAIQLNQQNDISTQSNIRAFDISGCGVTAIKSTQTLVIEAEDEAGNIMTQYIPFNASRLCQKTL